MTGIKNRSTPRKLAIINRKFWPICGAAELEVANLCRSLSSAERSVDVLTVRWQKHWPVRLRYRECDVYRLAKLSTGPFGTFRYLKSLTSHLSKHRYDGIIVFGLGEEGFTVATHCQHRALVLRITQLHLNGLDNFSTRQKETLAAATEIFADTVSTADFIGQHLPTVKDKVRVVAPVHAVTETINQFPASKLQPQLPRDFESRKSAARVALSDAHPILQIDNNQPLVVTCAPMENDLGVCDLVRAWKTVQRKHTKSRLWILGEGKSSRVVWDEILELDLVYTAIMPGFFDNLSLVLEAADLYVHPSRTDSSCCVLETAKAMGVCAVETASFDELKSAATTESTRAFIECPDRGLLVPRETHTALSATLGYLLDHEQVATKFGKELQRRILNSNVTDSPIDRYLNALTIDSIPTETP